MKSNSEKPAKGVRSLSTATKVLRLFDYISSLPDAVRLADICADLGLSRATAYQQTKTLVDAGWLNLRADGRYMLSLHSMTFATAAKRQMNVGERVQKILQVLVEKSGETASITMMQGGSPVIIHRVESDSPVIARQSIGTRLPLLDSGSGKIHIAFHDPSVRDQVDGSVNQEIPAEELACIQSEKIAFSGPSFGLLAAATPIFDTDGRCIAALSIVGLEHHNEIRRAGEHLLAAGKELTGIISI